jgi:hypothetical protein
MSVIKEKIIKERFGALFSPTRLHAAIRYSAIHLIASSTLVLIILFIVKIYWFPNELFQITKIQSLFVLIIVLNIISGPALTLLTFNPHKPRKEILVDTFVIFAIQSIILLYGLGILNQIRPIWIAFEKNAFRLVSLSEIDISPQASQRSIFRLTNPLGPKAIGVYVPESDSPDYIASLEKSLNGNHPAFRPDHWLPYQNVVQKVKIKGRNLSDIINTNPELFKQQSLQLIQQKINLEKVIYVPLITNHSEWSVLINKDNGDILGYIHLNGWN